VKEEWKDAVGYEGVYQVSNMGKVRSVNRKDACGHQRKGRVLRPSRDSDGYPVIVLRKNNKRISNRVHHLILEAFVGPRPEGMECCHIDGTKRNVSTNLEWNTHSKNILDCTKHGTNVDNHGSKSGMSKLTEEDIPNIRDELAAGFFLREIGEKYGVSRSTISDIKQGKTWTHVE